jgi:hypothetical protein
MRMHGPFIEGVQSGAMIAYNRLSGKRILPGSLGRGCVASRYLQSPAIPQAGLVGQRVGNVLPSIIGAGGYMGQEAIDCGYCSNERQLSAVLD